MNKKQVIKLALEILNSKLVFLERNIKEEEEQRKNSPSAMQSWSDNTRFEKEVLISQLEREKENMKKHIRFLSNLKGKKTKLEKGALVEADEFYFVSVFAGLELEIEGEKVFFISENSPLFKVLKDKKVKGVQ